ncbi:hypothetical protein [Erwinia aphidicola]|jgi:sulfur relay (sulfurtransferase) DsrC/TusE family protein|uniref:hypothetical protein n=1 Tax=Erwinia aphidicola TaxID=68334 RepID=UPI000789F48A|nr:sulfur relay (sulfurtransferase) DsrC/TusE family protein [Erwinia aphidicola]
MKWAIDAHRLGVKNAIQAAKNEFSKVKYLKNLFQYYTVSTRIRVLPGAAAERRQTASKGTYFIKEAST